MQKRPRPIAELLSEKEKLINWSTLTKGKEANGSDAKTEMPKHPKVVRILKIGPS